VSSCEVVLYSSEKKPLATLNYSGAIDKCVVTLKAHDNKILALSGKAETQLDFGKNYHSSHQLVSDQIVCVCISEGSTTFKVLQRLLEKMHLTSAISVKTFAKFLVTLPPVCRINIRACRYSIGDGFLEGETEMWPIKRVDCTEEEL
jgi:hypothetical protein